MPGGSPLDALRSQLQYQLVPSNSSCLSSQPRQCGPLLPPGSTSPALLAAGSNVPQNVLFVRVDSRAALVCVPAKAGSTAFYFWLYHILSGNPWPHRGPPWVQDVASGRWRAMARNSSRGGSIFVSRLHRMPAPKRAAALADRQVFRAALLRHPLQRAESAYLSKAATRGQPLSPPSRPPRPRLHRPSPSTAALALPKGVVSPRGRRGGPHPPREQALTSARMHQTSGSSSCSHTLLARRLVRLAPQWSVRPPLPA